jgi:hypothetical protein
VIYRDGHRTGSRPKVHSVLGSFCALHLHAHPARTARLDVENTFESAQHTRTPASIPFCARPSAAETADARLNFQSWFFGACTRFPRVSTSHYEADIVLASEKRSSLAGDRRKETVKLIWPGPETGRKIGTTILGHPSASAASLRVGANWR